MNQKPERYMNSSKYVFGEQSLYEKCIDIYMSSLFVLKDLTD
jgi:hypothetical protein